MKVLKVCLCARMHARWLTLHQRIAVLLCVRSGDRLWKTALNFTCTFMLNFPC